MESPTKRRRIERPFESDEDDDLLFQPHEASKRRDSDYQLQVQRAFADNRFQSTMAHIFEKYGRDFEGVGDEIDMMTGEIVVNNGHLKNMRNEGDIGTGLAQDAENSEDQDEDGGLRLEDLLDEDRFESSEDEEAEDEGEEEGHDNDEGDEVVEDEEHLLPQETELNPASTTALVTNPAETASPAAQHPQSFTTGLFGGMNPRGGPSMGFGVPSLGFGTSPLAFGHSPLAFNPWGQHLPQQQTMWDGPDIPQHEAMAIRMALQPRQQRQSLPSAALGTSIWTSGNRYESQLRARRSFQRSHKPRTGVKIKPRPRKQRQVATRSPSTAYDERRDDEEAPLMGKRRKSKRGSRKHQQEVQDSDDEGGLPSPTRREPLKDSRNQGNDKSPDQRAQGSRRSRKRKLSIDTHGRHSNISVDLALRSKSPSSSKSHDEGNGQHNDPNVENRGRYGRQRKPVEHFSQITWPISRQGKWRSERKAAAQSVAGQLPTEDNSSSSEGRASDRPSARKGQRHYGRKLTERIRGTVSNQASAVGKERFIPDSQDSLTPPNSSLPSAGGPQKPAWVPAPQATDDFDPSTVLSDDEKPMQVLPSRSRGSIATSATQKPRKSIAQGNEQAAPKQGRQPRQYPTSENLGSTTYEIPPPPSEGRWVLINTTKRPPYYRRFKEKGSRQLWRDPVPKDAGPITAQDSGHSGHNESDEWVLVNTTTRPPYYRRKRRSTSGLDSASSLKSRRTTRLSQGGAGNNDLAEELVGKLSKRRSEVRWLLKHNGEDTPEPEESEARESENDADEEDVGRAESRAGAAAAEEARGNDASMVHGDASTVLDIGGSRPLDAKLDTNNIGDQHTVIEKAPLISANLPRSSHEAINESPGRDGASVALDGSIEVDKLPSPAPPILQTEATITTMDETAPPTEEALPIVEEIDATPANEAGSEIPERETTVLLDGNEVQSEESRSSKTLPTVENAQSTVDETAPKVDELSLAVEITRPAAKIAAADGQDLTPTTQESAASDAIQTAPETSSLVVDETDQEYDQPSSAPLRFGSPELGSPAFGSSREDPFDLPPSPAAPPRISPGKRGASSPAKPSPLRKALVSSTVNAPPASKRKSISPAKLVSPSKVTKSPTPRTPRSRHPSPRKHHTPSSRRSLLSLTRNHNDDDLDELSFAEAPESTASTAASVSKRRSSVARKVWKATPRTTEVYRASSVSGKARDEELQGDITRTPGGTLRTCGVDGFTCGRDFCFSCL